MVFKFSVQWIKCNPLHHCISFHLFQSTRVIVYNLKKSNTVNQNITRTLSWYNIYFFKVNIHVCANAGMEKKCIIFVQYNGSYIYIKIGLNQNF